MGWSSGSTLFSDIINILNNNDIDDTTRKSIYDDMIPAFEDVDCDTLDECLGKDKQFDLAYREYYPEEEDDLDFEDDDY